MGSGLMATTHEKWKEEIVINNKQENIIKLGVGQIPLRQMCIWLGNRCYNKDLAIKYIKDTYDTDVSNEIIKTKEYSLVFNNDKDIFTYFEERYPPKKVQENTREWFNAYGRRRYQSFYNKFIENDNVIYDELIDFSTISHHVHHILPLEFGGSNSPKNMIGVITPFHKLLHMNPLQHIEKYCYQAIDYLKYLVYWNIRDVWDKYNIDKFEDDMKPKIFEAGLENEMNLFYEKLLKEYNTYGQ